MIGPEVLSEAISTDRVSGLVKALAYRIRDSGREVTSLPRQDIRFLEAASLAQGVGGAGLVIRYCAEALGDAGLAQDAEELLAYAVQALGRLRSSASLLDGFPGVLWAVDHLLEQFPQSSAHLDQSEAEGALISLVQAQPPRMPCDFGSGVAGILLYSRSGPEGRVALEYGCIEALSNRSTTDRSGEFFLTPSAFAGSSVPDDLREGYIDLGVAHGVPGIVASVVGSLGSPVPEVAQLAEAITRQGGRWMAEMMEPPGFLPGYIDRKRSYRGRCGLAWCYGPLGVGTVLLATGLPSMARLGTECLAGASRRFLAGERPSGLGLCHGLAGAVQCFRRAWESTRDRAIGEALVTGVGELVEAAADGADQDCSFLQGTGGVAIVLAGLLSVKEPAWDQVLLLSQPARMA